MVCRCKKKSQVKKEVSDKIIEEVKTILAVYWCIKEIHTYLLGMTITITEYKTIEIYTKK